MVTGPTQDAPATENWRKKLLCAMPMSRSSMGMRPQPVAHSTLRGIDARSFFKTLRETAQRHIAPAPSPELITNI
jgi:hypothetical protein